MPVSAVTCTQLHHAKGHDPQVIGMVCNAERMTLARYRSISRRTVSAADA